MIHPKISIIILNLNGKEVIGECLESIEKIDYPNYNVILVDNGSNDKSPQIAENFSNVHLIKNGKNVGVAEGFNIGIKYALEYHESDYVFTTNNDITLDKNVLKELLKVMDDKKIGISGPLTYYSDDPNRIQFAGGKVDFRKGHTTTTRTGQIDKGNLTIEETDYQGSIFISTNLLKKIGLFNSDYFAYWEDTEFCTRVKRANYKIVCVPTAKIWHKGSHTFKKMPKFSLYLITKNMFWFMKTYASKRQYIWFILCFFGFYFWIRVFIMIKNGNTDNFRCYIKGINDGLMKKIPDSSEIL